MKKFMKSLMLVAVAAMGFTACTNDMLDNVNKNTEETFTLTISSEKPALEGTRTEFSNGSIIWNQGDNIRATFNRGTEWGKYYASTTQSNEIATDGKTAKFTIGTAFTSSGSGDFMFYAGYPQNAIGSGTTAPTEGILGVTVPTEQTMTKMSTFDASADIMVGKSTQTYAEVTQTIPFHWTRLVSHACVTLKSLAAQDDEIVKYVTFTAPEGVALTGEGEVNFVEQSMTALDNNTVTVNLPANTTAKVAELPVWFCSAPATITSGNNLVVTVETTRGTYTRTITARSEGIKFVQNNYCTLGIDMASAEFTPAATSANVYQLITSVDELTTGEYVLAAKYNSAYYPMSTTFASKINATTTITVTNDQITETDADGYILTLTASTDGVSIYNGTNYLKYNSSTNFTTSTTASNWTVKYTDNQFQFLQTRYILWQYNSGSSRFGAYATSNWNATGYSGLYLFKKVSNNPDAPTLSLDKNAVEFEHAGGTATITATTTNYDGQITATSSNAHFTTSVNGNVVTVTAPANTEETVKTATITITAGTLSKEVTVSQAADLGLTGAGSEENPYTVADALKLIAANQHDTTKEVYVEGVVSYIKEAYNADYGNANYNISDNGEDTNSLNIYRGFYIDGADFTAENQLSLGDKVVVKGKLSVYGTTSQFAQGSQVVSVVKAGGSEEPTTPVDQTVTFTAKPTEVTVDETVTVTATANTTVTYTSSDTSIATVNETTGVVTGKAAGSVTITATAAATAEYNSATATHTITVKAAEQGGGDVETKISTLTVETINAVKTMGNGSYGEYKDTDVTITVEGVTYVAKNICATQKNTPSGFAAKTFIQIKNGNYIYNTTAVKSVKIWSNGETYNVNGGSSKNPTTKLTASNSSKEDVDVKDNNGSSKIASLFVNEFDITGGYFKINTTAATYIYKVEVTY